MLLPDRLRVGYVVKRYPRYSETFIVNEILAHEAAGLDLEVFALRPPVDTHFQDRLARVRARVNYLPNTAVKASGFWAEIKAAAAVLPNFWEAFPMAGDEGAIDVYQALALAKEVRRKKIDHLHAHFATSSTSVTRLAASFAGVPYSFTAHAKDIFHESVSADDLARKLADASAVVTVSDYNARFLHALFGAAAAAVTRVYNGLELTEFPYSAPRQRPPAVVSVGRLIPKKGFADLIDACARLAEQGVDFTCDIIGGGELEQSLTDQIERLELQGRVQLLGPRPQMEVIERVRRASVLAAPCVVAEDGNRDGLPTVLLEAMALGTPCVSTDVTGISEIVRDGETGLMVPQHDPPALAAALLRLLEDSELRVATARQARTLVEESFDIHRNAGALRELFCPAASRPLESSPQLVEVGS